MATHRGGMGAQAMAAPSCKRWTLPARSERQVLAAGARPDTVWVVLGLEAPETTCQVAGVDGDAMALGPWGTGAIGALVSWSVEVGLLE